MHFVQGISVTNHLTLNKQILPANPRRVGVIFQLLDKSPFAIFPEGLERTPLVLLTNYSTFSFDTEHYPCFEAWYALNDTDGFALGSLATIRILEFSK